MKTIHRIAVIVIQLALVLPAPSLLAKKLDDKLVVYSARKEHLIAPLFQAFEKQTGIKVQYITDKAPALLERIKAEGKRSPADILMTVDAGNLWNAAEQGVFTSVKSPVLDKHIPAAYRDPDGQWFGLSLRARTLAYNTTKVKPSELKNYADLADPKWKSRLCLRTAKKVYNQSLVAMLMEEYGEKEAEQYVQGWVDNLAAKVFSNDTAALEAVAAGQCDVALVNTYYFGRLQEKNPKLPVALYFPTAKTGGTHVNVSGAGILKTSKNKAAAQKLLEWLTSDEAQQMFAALNHEYPVKAGVPVSAIVKAWGTYEPMTTNLSRAGASQAAAIKLMDRAGYH